jgi:hypothetical protein
LQAAVSKDREGALKHIENARKLRSAFSPKAAPLVDEVTRGVLAAGRDATERAPEEAKGFPEIPKNTLEAKLLGYWVFDLDESDKLSRKELECGFFERMTALADTTFDGMKTDPDRRGRLVESAVGAHLRNTTVGTATSVQYWLHRNREVDFVLVSGKGVVAIEVKSGLRKTSLPGIAAFAEAFPVKRQLLVGAQGIALEEFLRQPASHWLE